MRNGAVMDNTPEPKIGGATSIEGNTLIQSDLASPLRYPGGKSRVAKRIASLFPSFEEFREPFVGGGSIFLELAKLRPDARFWINDLYPEVSNFWLVVLTDLPSLVEKVLEFRRSEQDGKQLYLFLRQLDPRSPLERAARFFILNRITFSGTLDSGGYSQMAFEKRFTETSIDRLASLGFLSSINISVTNEDYSVPVSAPGTQVLLFLDPPYITNAQKLYGRGGDLHRNFDHERFSRTILESEHSWLVTYNDGETTNRLFPESDNVFHMRWQQHYPMKSSLGSSVPKGRELIVANFQLERGDL